MNSYYRQQLEDWLKTIDVKADKILDIGGAQLPIKGRTKSWDVKDYKIMDLEKPHECKRKPDYKFDIQKYFVNNDNFYKMNEKFNICFCLEVSEYWLYPVQALYNIHFLLKPKGILYISFPFIYPHHNPEGYDYLRYTRWGIEKLLKETGFEIDYIKSRIATAGAALLQKFYSIEGMRKCKDYINHNEIGYLIKTIKK